MRIRFFASLLFIFAFTFAPKIQAQDFIKLEGKVLAADSKEPVPFASIGIPEKGIGNICNEVGAFELKIPVGDKNAKVCISALGFKELCLPAITFKGQNHSVFLEPANLQLATVEIKAISAESLVKEAIRRIPENYADKPVKYTFYQRQHTNINEQPAYMIESVNEAYFNYPGKHYQLRVHKSRGMIMNRTYEAKMNRDYISFYDITNNSILSKDNDFLHPSKFKNYNFTFFGEELLGRDTVLILTFSPKPKRNGQENAGNFGKLFLQKNTLAIARIESQLNDAFIENINSHLLLKLGEKMAKMDFTLESKSMQTNYKRIGNRWYLHNVFNSASFTKVYKNKPTPERNNNFRQLVVTNLQTENAPQIPEPDRIKTYRNPYSTSPKDMNEAFWLQYNVLPLPEAYQKMQN